MPADADSLDRVARGFARVIDAKSPWTYKHSTGVSTIAAGIAETMGMPFDEVRAVRRAGLLHDVGKLGVSNRILDVQLARFVGVADMFEALTAKRPYRQDLSDAEVMDIMGKNVAGGGICPEVFEALKAYEAGGGYSPAKVAA